MTVLKIFDGQTNCSPAFKAGNGNFFEVNTLAFIKDLYRDEMRSGYLVKADIKKVWNRQLEIWQEVDKICRKHGITYWAAYGTLIGAARHKGFIPWDEDLDLCMMRPDFNRFCDVLDELGDSFAVAFRNFSTLKIAHNQTTLISLGTFEEGEPCGLMIDIFALDIFTDGTPESLNALNATKEIYQAMSDCSQLIQRQRDGECFVNDLELLEYAAALHSVQDKLNLFNLYANNLFDQSSAVVWFEDFIYGKCERPFKKAWFDETIYLPFETVELPAPKMFDEVLTSFYGDWRTPVNDGQHKLGFIHSADIPWQEFLQRVNIKKVLQKIFRGGLDNWLS